MMTRPSLLLKQMVVTAAIIGVASACMSQSRAAYARKTPQQEIAITLDVSPDVAPDRWRGMFNIFFTAASRSLQDSMRAGDGWTAVEVADVVAGQGLRAIR